MSAESPQAPLPTGTAAGQRARIRFELWLVPAVILLDQVVKAVIRRTIPLHDLVPVIDGWLNLTHVQNTGAAFGLLNDAEFAYKPVVVAGFAAVALAGIGAFAARLNRDEVMARVGLALILGGAAGNLIDRIVAGAVVDYVDVVFGSWHFWAFNVADAAITVGVIAMLLDMAGIGTHASTAS